MAVIRMLPILCIGLLLMSHVMGDVYMHNMRGSNNRLAETTAQRTNGNRLFDSQVYTYIYHNHYHIAMIA